MTKDSTDKRPGPNPERLVIEDDPEEALGRLLGKEQPGSDWIAVSETLPAANRTVEWEDEHGRRYRTEPGPYELGGGTGSGPRAVRWRYVED